MPNNEPEQESYSIDDMMDRLRTRGGGPRDGEAQLVTREDGTQVYKVKKRKRRSHQPKKEKEKRDRKVRVAQVVAAAGIMAVSGLGILGSWIYLNSSPYQRKVVERVREWTGAEPKFSQFRASPVSAGAESVELKWPDSSVVESLSLNGVKADLNPSLLVRGVWKGTELVAGSGGSLVLRSPSGPAPVPLSRSGEPPFRFRYRGSKFNVLIGGDQPRAKLNNSEVTLDVLDPTATTANLRFEGGTLNVVGWGDFFVKFASIQLERPGGMRVGNIRLSPGTKDGKGEIEIVNPGQESFNLREGESVLSVRVRRLPVESVLGPYFGGWLTAEVETTEGGEDGKLVFDGANPASLSYRVPFRTTTSSNTVWKQLPAFGVLAREVGETWYQSPIFDSDTTGALVRTGSSAGLEGIRFTARNRMTVGGNFLIDSQGGLDGVLEIGLPEAVVNHSPSPSFRAVFKKREGGYAWASVRLSGTGRQPKDDFQQQIDAAATGTSPAAGGNQALEEAFEELLKPQR